MTNLSCWATRFVITGNTFSFRWFDLSELYFRIGERRIFLFLNINLNLIHIEFHIFNFGCLQIVTPLACSPDPPRGNASTSHFLGYCHNLKRNSLLLLFCGTFLIFQWMQHFPLFFVLLHEFLFRGRGLGGIVSIACNKLFSVFPYSLIVGVRYSHEKFREGHVFHSLHINFCQVFLYGVQLFLQLNWLLKGLLLICSLQFLQVLL